MKSAARALALSCALLGTADADQMDEKQGAPNVEKRNQQFTELLPAQMIQSEAYQALVSAFVPPSPLAVSEKVIDEKERDKQIRELQKRVLERAKLRGDHFDKLERLLGPYAQKDLYELMKLVGNDDVHAREAAFEELKLRAGIEVDLTKRPLSWDHLLEDPMKDRVGFISPDDETLRQRRARFFIRRHAEKMYALAKIDGSPFVAPKSWESRSPSVSEFLVEISAQTGVQFDLAAGIKEEIGHLCILSFSGNTFWEVLRTAKMSDGQSLPFGNATYGTLKIAKKNPDLPDLCATSSGGIYSHLKRAKTSVGTCYYVHLKAEPHLRINTYTVQNIDAVSSAGRQLNIQYLRGGFGGRVIYSALIVHAPKAETPGETMNLTIRYELEVCPRDESLVRPQNVTKHITSLTYKEVPLEQKEISSQ